ncbi:hypothetical protein BX616_000159 [Lobosporangium transversale]|uniref:Uncharacterized protein n=1 Tax=Lobosporangium transversale TaxID=64571 RepID=A0A1Y2GGR7_9FUNG|nr:hypothetical protein BCR41DRAFT_357807 [Lobosporangium transversale]KAF9908426.1 hypothetical protein BX616_000159 [Lobosporangium transversale]ORZ10343.1 hypothetical protein BCR41DRAFT_357807 [Lobosporangium transversale]|eukprot:XP_021879250.1 hypothetical protein BCR41DRAFT_357807 [Lobosporangium transversale]
MSGYPNNNTAANENIQQQDQSDQLPITALINGVPLPAPSQVQPGADAQLGGQLDSVEYISSSRPPVGPLDLPSDDMANASPPAHLSHPPIQAQHGSTPQNDINKQSMGTQTEQQNNSPIVHVASEEAVAAARSAKAVDAADAAAQSRRGRRRSSLAVLADKFRDKPWSRSHSRGRDKSGEKDEFTQPLPRSRSNSSFGRRLSLTFSRHAHDEDEEEHAAAAGPYKAAKLAQQEYMAKIRAEQERLGITHNVDGLPIPQQDQGQRRRSSVTHLLGLDKPLLSR